MVEVSVTGKNTQNMRIMRIHEEGLFKKIIMPYIKRGPGRDPKHEADMRIHEADDAEKPFFFPLEDAMKDDLVRIMLWVVVIVSISAMVWVVFGE